MHRRHTTHETRDTAHDSTAAHPRPHPSPLLLQAPFAEAAAGLYTTAQSTAQWDKKRLQFVITCTTYLAKFETLLLPRKLV